MARLKKLIREEKRSGVKNTAVLKGTMRYKFSDFNNNELFISIQRFQRSANRMAGAIMVSAGLTVPAVGNTQDDRVIRVTI
jgi:hypothetical protein